MTMSSHEIMIVAVNEMLKSPGYPKVGAVIAGGGHVLSTGFRGEDGGKHAERVAIEKLGADQLAGSTLYTTLEPCTEVYTDQPITSCAQLIVSSGIRAVMIGALDPNGKVYSNGMNFLRDRGLDIGVFSPDLRDAIEARTFSYDNFNAAVGSGTRRIRSVQNGKKLIIRFSVDDSREIAIRISPLSMPKDRVDLIAARDSVRLAPGVREFHDIVDPLLYQDPSHFARLVVGEIAIVAAPKSTMVLLVKILEITPTDITVRWEVRNRIAR